MGVRPVVVRPSAALGVHVPIVVAVAALVVAVVGQEQLHRCAGVEVLDAGEAAATRTGLVAETRD